MGMSRMHRPPMSITKLAPFMKRHKAAAKVGKKGSQERIAVVVGTITDDMRNSVKIPKMKVCALRVTEKARGRILKAGGEIITFDQLLVFPTATLLQLSAPRDASLNVLVVAGSLEDIRPKKLIQPISLIKALLK